MKNLNNIADEMIKEGTEYTDYGNWAFYYDEAYDGVLLGDLEEDEINELVEILEGREEVAEVDVEEDCISVDFWLMYCPQVEDEEEEE